MMVEMIRVIRSTAAALAASCAVPAAAQAVAIAQHPLPGPAAPAVSIAATSTGIAITRGEGPARIVLDRVEPAPFSVGTAEHVEAIALGTGPSGELWAVAGVPSQGLAAPPLALLGLPATGAPATRYSFPAPLGETEWPAAFAAAPDGSVWIANQTGESIEHVSPTGRDTVYPLPRSGAPVSIAVAPDGSAWFAELAAGAIGEVTLAGAVVEHQLPGLLGASGFGMDEPSSIALGPDGAMWFTEQATGRIGRIDGAGDVTEYPIPGPPGVPPGFYGSPAPRALTAGPEGAIWFTDDGDDSIGRITTGGAVTEYPIGTSTPASPQGIAAYGGELWFVEENLSAIGSADPSAAAPAADPPAPRPRRCTRERRRGPRRVRCASRRRGISGG